MWEHPELVFDESALRCPDCQRKDDPQITDSEYVNLKRYYAKPGITNHEFQKQILPHLQELRNIRAVKKTVEKWHKSHS